MEKHFLEIEILYCLRIAITTTRRKTNHSSFIILFGHFSGNK